MRTTDTKYFDYIIAGGGCAGLSLLYKILKEPKLNKKSILVLDSERKLVNDRTWCFWEKKPGPFENIVSHKWRKLKFVSDDLDLTFKLEDYTYKLIKGIDFYQLVMNAAQKYSNVEFLNTTIKKIESVKNEAQVITSNGTFCSQYIFNSTPFFNPVLSTKDTLLQHFEGWIIKTSKTSFDKRVGTLMDFRMPQTNGTTFMYVLPLSQEEALVEYTLFSPSSLEKHEYRKALQYYIENHLDIAEYTIVHKESGAIPMSIKRFKRVADNYGRIINIGTAGGDTKASTGYTFNFIQQRTSEITSRLKLGRTPAIDKTYRKKMFDWYDRTLLDVLLKNKIEGKEVFTAMFKNLPPEIIFEFLANKSNFYDELRVMCSLPTTKFASSGINQMIYRV